MYPEIKKNPAYPDWLYRTHILDINDKISLFGCVVKDLNPPNPVQCMKDVLCSFIAYPSFASLGDWENLPIYKNEPSKISKSRKNDIIAAHLESFKDYAGSYADITAYAITKYDSKIRVRGETQPVFCLHLEDGVTPPPRGKFGGVIGFMFTTKSDICKQFETKTITQDILDEVHETFLYEFYLWSSYIAGEVYAYFIFSDSNQFINGTDPVELAEEYFDAERTPLGFANEFYHDWFARGAMVEQMEKIKEESCK